MNAAFKAHMTELPSLCDKLLQSKPLTSTEIAQVRDGGVYTFSEEANVLYVGRTRNLRNRYRAHCGLGSKENSAAFAFRLAREVTGNMKATYTKVGSRKALMQEEAFANEFIRSKQRIAAMHLRFLEENDDIRQALLEIYVSLATGAKHNTFSTT